MEKPTNAISFSDGSKLQVEQWNAAAAAARTTGAKRKQRSPDADVNRFGGEPGTPRGGQSFFGLFFVGDQ